MKKLIKKLAIIPIMIISLVACNSNATVYEAIHDIGTTIGEPVDNSDKYDLDEKFNYFQLFQLGGDCILHLKATTGIVTYYFTSIENEDGSVNCTLTGIYVYNVGNIAFGPISEEFLLDYVDKLTFTIILEENVVTSHDLPQLIVKE